jgi:polyisoprenyl-phosphate glycosyltransferase
VILTVAVPCYNEEGNVRALYRELLTVLPRLGIEWEILFSDDGSTDTTWEQIEALSQEDGCVRGIRLSRNFGHQYALLAALERAAGDAVVTMDGDLQHPPGLIPELLQCWRRGSKIVHTVRVDRAHVGRFKRLTSQAFYRLFSWLSGIPLTPGMADYRLLDRQVVDALLQFKEGDLFLRGLVQWVGYPSTTVSFECQDRYSGTTKYTLRRMLRFALTGLTAFSVKPLRLSIILGGITALLALLEMIYAIVIRFTSNNAVPGWASAMAVLSLLMAVLFVLIGIQGEYIGRILTEVKGRPRYLISDEAGTRARREAEQR